MIVLPEAAAVAGLSGLSWPEIISVVTALFSGGGVGAWIYSKVKKTTVVSHTERLQRANAEWSETILARIREVETQNREMSKEMRDRETWWDHRWQTRELEWERKITELRHEIDRLKDSLAVERNHRESAEEELASLRAAVDDSETKRSST